MPLQLKRPREESSEHEAKLEQDIRLYFRYHHHNTALDLIVRFFLTFIGHVSIGRAQWRIQKILVGGI